MKLWNLLNSFALGVTFPFFSIILERGGLTPSQIGLAFTVGNLAGGLFSYYIGKLSDRIGRLKMLVSMTLLTGLSFMLLFVESQPLVTVMIFTLLMMGGGAASTIVTAYSIDALDGARISRGSGFGAISMVGAVGWVPGTLAGGVLVSVLGLRPVFLFAGVIIGLSALTCYGLAESRLEKKDDGVSFSSRGLLTGPPGFLLTIITLAFVADASIASFFSLHMINSLGASPLEVSAAFAIMGLSEIPAMIYLGKLSDKVGRRPILLLCLAAFPLRMALTALAGDSTVAILAQTLSSLTFGGLYVVSIAYASDIVPESMRGAYMGLYAATIRLGGIIGGYLWGSIAEASSYAAMFLYCSAFSLVQVFLAGIAFRRKRVVVFPARAEP
ncbi:MAG: MFS transporter [Nitrososphaerota archaeon]|nr:MFS transporter [Nitrososphaerota archaeon]